MHWIDRILSELSSLPPLLRHEVRLAIERHLATHHLVPRSVFEAQVSALKHCQDKLLDLETRLAAYETSQGQLSER